MSLSGLNLSGLSPCHWRGRDEAPSGCPINGDMPHTVDYRPLTAPIQGHEVSQYRSWYSRSNPTPFSVRFDAAIRAVTILTACVFGVVMGVFVITIGLQIVGGGTALGVVPVIAGLLLAVGMIPILATSFRGTDWHGRARLDHFARANGLVFSPTSPDPNYPGAIFNVGNSRAAVTHLRRGEGDGSVGRWLDYGNYRYTTGSGRNARTQSWGFMALHLDRRLPHIVLDATANNGPFGSNLPIRLDRTQRLSLEGDFDRYFTLYCPRGYERDALYVFAPDLMALFIDEVAAFDAEIVDDWLFVYSATPFRMIDPLTHARIFSIVATVGRKTLTQTDMYADERIGDRAVNLVAPQGQRLRQRVAVLSTLGVLALVALGIWGYFQLIGLGL